MFSGRLSETPTRWPPWLGATKNWLAKPRSDWLGRSTVPGAAPGPTAVLITGAIGRAERTEKTPDSTDLSSRLQPEKVLPVHTSHAVPGVIWMLLAVNGGSMWVSGPARPRLGPLKCPLL